MGCVTLTAGGDFHPALRTSAARNGRPDLNMTKASGVSKRLPHRNLHVPMPMEQGSGPFRPIRAPICNRLRCRPDVSVARVRLKKARRGGAWRALWPRRIKKELTNMASPCTARIRFRFVLKLIIMTEISCGQSRAFVVDGLRGRLRRFRKSHHLSPASPRDDQEDDREPSGDCGRPRRITRADPCVRNQQK